MKHDVVNQEPIDKTLEFWGTRSGQKLTTEDARLLNLNLTQFFEILVEWDVRDR